MPVNKTSNRRRGPDLITRAISIFAGISWLLITIVIFLHVNSKPRDASLYDMRFSVAESYKGDPSLIIYANIVLILVAAICFAGILISLKRHKRKNDRFSKSLIFFGAGSVIWFIYNSIFN